MRAPDPVATARLRSLAPETDAEAEPEPAAAEPPPWSAPTTLSGYVRSAVRARLPAPLRGGQVDPGRRGAYLLAALGLAAAAVATGVAVHGRAHSQPPAAAPAPAVAADDPTLAGPSVQVDVEGRVRRPGVVTLPPGSRVAQAIAAAGGALPGVDTSNLDLAQKVTDGQQLKVGAGPVLGTVAGSSSAESASPGGLLDLNSATAEQLDGLPRVGPSTAQKIIAWRTAHGGFTSVDQLQQIAGIGPSTYQQIAPLVTV